MLKIPTDRSPTSSGWGGGFHVVAAEQLSVLGQAWSADSRPLCTGHGAQSQSAGRASACGLALRQPRGGVPKLLGGGVSSGQRDSGLAGAGTSSSVSFF